MFQEWSPSRCFRLVQVILSLYKKANNNPNAPIQLKIWDVIQTEYFKTLAKLSYDQLKKDDIIFDFHFQLYINLNITSDNEKSVSNFDLNILLSCTII